MCSHNNHVTNSTILNFILFSQTCVAKSCKYLLCDDCIGMGIVCRRTTINLLSPDATLPHRIDSHDCGILRLSLISRVYNREGKRVS